MPATKFNAWLASTTDCVPARVVLAGLCLLGFINFQMTRVCLSVTLVAMVRQNASLNNHTAPCQAAHVSTLLNTSREAEDEAMTWMSDVIQDQEGEMEWSETVQGFVLGSFYYGYAILGIIGGRIADVYGTRWLFGGAILAGGVACLLTPLASRTHYGLLIALRVLLGFLQGAAWPAIMPLVVRWFPPLERPRFVGTVCYSNTLSTALTLGLCGFVIDAWGWEAGFYVPGMLALLWCVLWFCLMYDHPAEHPRISKAELEYITTATKANGTYGGVVGRGGSKQRQPVPWRSIFTSVPVWALLVCSAGNSWGIGIFYSQLPTYMKNILGFSIKANGVLSALPFLSRYLGAVTWGNLAVALTSRGHMSILTSRRIGSMIALWGPAVMLICLATTECDWRAAVTFMCVALFCNGAVCASTGVNHTDIAPNHAGTLFGMDNTLFSILAFVSPAVIGMMTDGQQTLAQWRKVFWTCVPFYGLTEIFFLVFGSASVQPWNFVGTEPSSEDDAEQTELKGGEREGEEVEAKV